MKIPGRSSRPLAVLAGAALVTAALAGGAPATAVARGGGHPGPRASARALLLGRGIGLTGLSGHRVRASALPVAARAIPEPGIDSLLMGVFCTSSANCWAVGYYSPTGIAVLNEVLHWNGSAWAQVTVPSPAGSAAGDLSQLLGVRCTGVGDCWAAGIYEPSGGALLEQTLHWNGTTWSRVPTPDPGGRLAGDINELFEVVCSAAANCWAVGEYGTRTGPGEALNQVLHWNGRRWALVAVPDPGGSVGGDLNRLDSVRCPSATSCLAVGTDGTMSNPETLVNQALQWNGTTWSEVTVPSPGGTTGNGNYNELQGLGCTAPSNCWAVGLYAVSYPSSLMNEAMHWNGTAWTQITTPQPSGTGVSASQQLVFVNCQDAADCWAVGDYGANNGTGLILNQALHWDGGTWTLTDTPELGGAASDDINALRAVRCTSGSNCWAVGFAKQSGESFFFGTALHWNGTGWFAG